MINSDLKVPGLINGSGGTLVIDHTTDNTLMTFRFKHPAVKMFAAEDDFELTGHKFRAGAFVIPNADVAALRGSIQDLGLSAWAVGTAPSVKTHEMEIPRIGYVHAWQRTQDEGWVRAALDTYGVPYTAAFVPPNPWSSYASFNDVRPDGTVVSYAPTTHTKVWGNNLTGDYVFNNNLSIK